MSAQEKGISRWFVITAAAVPTLVSAITGVITLMTGEELKRIEAKRNYDLEIYQAAKEALLGSDEEKKAVIALIMSVGEDPLKTELIKAFDNAENSSVAVIETARTNLSSDSILEKKEDTQNRWGSWDFDLFYCESSPIIAREDAAKLASELREDGAEGRIRVRPLTRSTNSQLGYNVSGYQLRPNGSENAIATQLNDFASLKIRREFDLLYSGQNTPLYVSAFFCPEPT